MTGKESTEKVVIKKYANRRLYNTATSAYVTLEDLSTMVKEGEDFKVVDAKSGDDITRAVLTQIIFEEESKGHNLLPINFLRQLIGFYGDSMQAFVPSYLEFSLDSLTREQEKFQKKMAELGGTPFNALEEQTRQNMAMFQQAMQVFNPFAAMAQNESGSADASPSPASEKSEPGSKDDSLNILRDQISALERKLDDLAGK